MSAQTTSKILDAIVAFHCVVLSSDNGKLPNKRNLSVFAGELHSRDTIHCAITYATHREKEFSYHITINYLSRNLHSDGFVFLSATYVSTGS